MKLFDILKNKEALFIIDDVEDKKTKELIKDINMSLINIVVEYDEFNEFAQSQIQGEYHQKLVNLKSLKEHYGEWNGIKIAFSAHQREEENRINKLYSNKSALINKLKALQSDAQKLLPVVSGYHISKGDLVESKEEHQTIILGNHNTNVIETVIEELNSDIVVEGNFDKVNPKELKANYAIVNNNVKMCEERIAELFSNKKSKADKLDAIINSMSEVASNLVFFETYKQVMLDVGCPIKDLDLLQKELLKKYIPCKKQLQKALKIKFEDIADVIIDESEYQSTEKEDSLFEDIEDLFSDLGE